MFLNPNCKFLQLESRSRGNSKRFLHQRMDCTGNIYSSPPNIQKVEMEEATGNPPPAIIYSDSRGPHSPSRNSRPMCQCHPRLVAWKVSRRISEQREFQKTLIISSWRGKPIPTITLPGRNGIHGDCTSGVPVQSTCCFALPFNDLKQLLNQHLNRQSSQDSR